MSLWDLGLHDGPLHFLLPEDPLEVMLQSAVQHHEQEAEPQIATCLVVRTEEERKHH